MYRDHVAASCTVAGPNAREVAQHDVVDRWVGMHVATEPGPGRRADDLTGPRPQPSGWNLDERKEVPACEREGGGVVLRELRRQLRPKFAGVARFGEDACGVLHDRVEIDVDESRRVVAMRVQLLREHRLRERTEHEAVIGGDRVHRSSLHDEPNHLTIQKERLQLTGLEIDEARPQPDVRVARLLCLETDEMRDELARRHRRPFQQMLARERRSIELTHRQHALILRRHDSGDGWNLLAAKTAPCGSASTVIRTGSTSNGGTMTFPPRRSASAAIASASSTANVTLQCAELPSRPVRCSDRRASLRHR